MAALISPLVRLERGSFQPKIVGLYRQLFTERTDVPNDDGFWVEFFLLRANPASLSVILSGSSTDELLRHQAVTRAVFARGVNALSDENSTVVLNALETLTMVLREVLAKPMSSAEAITVLVGLEHVDRVFTTFVASLERIIRKGQTSTLRIAGLRAALSTVCGAYKTSLINFFIQRDFFPALVQIIYIDETTSHTVASLILLGILSNYDKLEAYNPYQTRLADFADNTVMQRIVATIGQICKEARSQYIEVMDDVGDGFSLESVLSSYAGIAKRAKLFMTQDTRVETGAKLSALPPLPITVLLAAGNFVHANKYFARLLIESKTVAQEESPFGLYISLSSYLVQHQHRSERHALYSRQMLLVFRVLIEDAVTMQKLISIECRSAIRISRQRQPPLPVVKGERYLAEGILDAAICALDHNKKRALDVPMYSLAVGITLRIISQLKRLRTRLPYHWSELWRSMFSFLRFANGSASHLASLPGMDELVNDSVRVLVLAFSAGESFLAGAADYDDMFYKLIENGEVLSRLCSVYNMPRENSAIGTLLSVLEHYKNLLRERSLISGQLSSEQVQELIKTGYDTLSISAQQGIDSWDRYRESDERLFLKKIGSVAVADARELLGKKLMPGIDGHLNIGGSTSEKQGETE
ncbi:hypothetical protein V1512DRAFT_96354 [Lipomyces arxii]|uniref:uncharacterized protein n=1 Tax=Lipomyces arxii TaxID=56418 RepID=UPI0034CEBD76